MTVAPDHSKSHNTHHRCHRILVGTTTANMPRRNMIRKMTCAFIQLHNEITKYHERFKMESKEELDARLNELEQRGPRSNSKVERLRQTIDRIEELLKKGFTQAEVLEVLNAAGFDMTLASFKSTLQRLRKERRTKQEASAKSLANVLSKGIQRRP